jgi:threonine/homoserine/homoserine lactone efflux protein
MFELETLLAFLIASVSLTLLPGPDNLFVLSLSAIRGAKVGIPVALGLAAGNFLHTLAVALGFSALIAHTPGALTAIKILGVIYLLYLAWQSWQHPVSIKQTAQAAEIESPAKFQLFKRGILMNALNPKVILFFVAFFPQFIDKNSAQPALNIFLLGTLFVLQTAIIFSLIALAAGRIQKFIQHIDPRQIAMITSALFVLLAVALALHNLS